jgi:hypothetical protein
MQILLDGLSGALNSDSALVSFKAFGLAGCETHPIQHLPIRVPGRHSDSIHRPTRYQVLVKMPEYNRNIEGIPPKY